MINVAIAIIKKFLADKTTKIGINVYIQKGITLGYGIEAVASSVAALVAMNAFF